MGITFETNDGEEINLPVKFEVCPRCEGKGKHDHPAFSNGITSEEWDRDWDEDEREGYLSGRYDVTCEECKGLRVVEVVAVERLTPEIRKQWEKWEEDMAELEQMERMEREYGA